MRAIDDRIKIYELEMNKFSALKSLRVYIDDHLTRSTHIDKISKRIASVLGELKRIRPFHLTANTAVQVYQALIQPHFDYCCSVWDGFRETLS